VFYASIVGKPSNEVSNPNAAANFEAVHTSSLVDGLNAYSGQAERPFRAS
jgi:hypothetical protein